MNNTLVSPETSTSIIDEKFQLLKQNQFKIGNESVSDKKKKLKKLYDTVLKYRPQIKEAMYKDFRKHPSEVDLTEVYPVTSEIKHARRHLRKWTRKHRVGTPLALLGSSSFIKYEPKGVVLIISPWNFPFNLTLGPLVSAISAGNTIMVKPSEHTPHSSSLMKKIISEVFEENEVVLVEGGIETSKKILSLPFNHIFFTGAPSIGKVVMEAASKHLTSVTLELGGKSPTIVDNTANIDTAARRIAWGKFLNNGQVCIAPDYVFVHESIANDFLKKVKQYILKFYSENASNEDSYNRIVNNKHHERIKRLIDNAIENGSIVETGNQLNSNDNYISPTVLSNVGENSKIMEQEIFGPVLPIHTFNNLNQIIDKINEKEKPLALYVFSKSKKNVNYILENTRAGGGCINHSAVHFFNTNLPFGGSNNSGIGKGHGWYGFESFSNPRGILKQHIPNALELLLPPYNDFKQKLIDLTIKFF
ncbi:aldehyde dehydrogenase (NAD+) [Tenacibaculum sp. MAR_2009_124]|uniref:aldehyde dehydrogenase family protein n=1 Tax=Tenacibaculum sp. MAR_2009_124 TaxID=1250059 RepID=UPI000898B245|nr:aldehyde dehydrogenase family protein [Tenacibaculum sp. MAR_2009_124]SEB45367.1 aldehyde dehydrogenase (NAD+) [Tenacibaculum sp. MAR_2009_124]